MVKSGKNPNEGHGAAPFAANSGRTSSSPEPVNSDPRIAMALRSTGFNGVLANKDAGLVSKMPVQSFSLAAPVAPAKAVLAQNAHQDSLRAGRRDWLLTVMEEQRRLSVQASGLMRCQNLSSEAFLDHFYAPGRPVVIEGALSGWPALERWTPDYLKETVGDASVEYQGGRTAASDFELAKDRHKRTMPFSAFIDQICADDSGGNDAYITAYNSATNQSALAPLQNDLGRLDAYLTGAPGMMWIGPGNTFTPLHFDLTNNLLIQIVGRKRILLIPPTQTRFMYHHRHVFSDIHDLEDEAAVCAHPLARNLTPYEVVLAPGEMLYIPIGWWHQVRSLDFSVMLTHTDFLWPNDHYADYPAD